MLVTLPYGKKRITLEIENAEIVGAEEMPVIDSHSLTKALTRAFPAQPDTAWLFG